jgi:hypothetical protein
MEGNYEGPTFLTPTSLALRVLISNVERIGVSWCSLPGPCHVNPIVMVAAASGPGDTG